MEKTFTATEVSHILAEIRGHILEGEDRKFFDIIAPSHGIPVTWETYEEKKRRVRGEWYGRSAPSTACRGGDASSARCDYICPAFRSNMNVAS